jgi:hypothetical protein
MALDRKMAQRILDSSATEREGGVLQGREGWLDHLWSIVRSLDINAGQREGLTNAIYGYGVCVDREMRSYVEGVAAGEIDHPPPWAVG